MTATTTRKAAEKIVAGDTIRLFNHVTGAPRDRKVEDTFTGASPFTGLKITEITYSRGAGHKLGGSGRITFRASQKVHVLDAVPTGA